MSTKLFDSAVAVSAGPSVAAARATYYKVDLATAGANVDFVFSAVGATIGQAIGVYLDVGNDVNVVTFSGDVDGGEVPLNSAGDWALFAYDGTTWSVVGYDASPGFLDALSSTAVGLYRFISPSNLTTDYSGNGRTLTVGTVTASPGIAMGRGSVKGSSTSVATSTNAAFRLQAAMSCIVLVNTRVSAAASGTFVSVGVAGGGATAVQWSLGSSGTGAWQYFHETAGGADVVYAPTTVSPIAAGWFVAGFTRSAGGIVKLYGNGTLLATSGVLAMPTDGASANLSIGAVSGGGFATNADMAQLGVYSAELTAAQMLRGARLLMGSHR